MGSGVGRPMELVLARNNHIFFFRYSSKILGKFLKILKDRATAPNMSFFKKVKLYKHTSLGRHLLDQAEENDHHVISIELHVFPDTNHPNEY
jgi:hypothetical protein